jgi:flagellar hook-associated protein 3 FlgL
MRITTNMFAESFVSETQRLQKKQIDSQRAIASGQRIHNSSDDPSSFRQSLEVQSSQRTRLQHKDNIRELTARSEIYHGYSTKVHELASRASELLTRVNASYSQTELDTTANELDGLLKQAIAIGNSEHDGQFLFGGTYLQPGDTDPTTATLYRPYTTTQDIDGKIITVTYRGNNEVNRVQIDANTVVDSNVLGTSSTAQVRALFQADVTADLFQTLMNVRDELLLGTTSNISGQLSNLRNVDENVAKIIGSTAADLSRLKLTEATHDDRLLTDETIISRLMDTDMVKAATDLQRSLAAYEAALQTGARVLNISLLDFL